MPHTTKGSAHRAKRKPTFKTTAPAPPKKAAAAKKAAKKAATVFKATAPAKKTAAAKKAAKAARKGAVTTTVEVWVGSAGPAMTPGQKATAVQANLGATQSLREFLEQAGWYR